MDVGADAAGQVISLAGQVFKIGMEGMVVVVKIAGKGAAHAAALLAAALSGKKKTRGKVMLKNMLRDSKSLTLFTIKESDLATFAKEAKVYNVRYCIVKDKNANDGNIDMFIRAEDAAVVNRIIERHGLTAVSQDVTIANEPERAEGEGYEDENYVYGDVTISRELNSLVEESGETETQIKTRVPGTFGKNVRYVYFDKEGLEEVHGGKSYKVHIKPEGSYELYNGSGAVAETVSGEELLKHYDRKGSEEEALQGNSKARTASEAQSGKSYSEQEDYKENSKLSDTGKQADVKQPDYVYGDVTISREVNSLVDEAGETDTQIKTRVPGTYGKDIRYVYFDKASLEEVHGGKSYKVHIEPERKYELYNKSGAVVQTVYGEELLSHYDRKDKDKDGAAAAENPEAVETSVHQSEKSAAEHTTEAEQQEKVSSPEPVQEDNLVSANGMVSTNMGDMPVEDYREIIAGQYGFDSYDELYAAGLRIGGGYDKEPEPETVQGASNAEKYDVLAVNNDGEILAYSLNEETFYNDDRNGMTVLRDTKLPRTEPRSEAEMRPSVREKLDGYMKEEQDNALERQIKATEEKRERETKRLEREGGDVLSEQRAKMDSYARERDDAMADFLSDAKIPEEESPVRRTAHRGNVRR